MGFFQDIIAQDPTYSLDSAYDMLLNDYPHDFRSYWGLEQGSDPDHLDAADQAEYRRLSQLTTKLAQGASLLVRPPKLREDDIRQMAWIEEEAETLRERLRETLEQAKNRLPHDVWWQVYWATRPQGPGDPRVKQEFMEICMQLEAAELFPAWPGDIAKRLFHLVALVLENPTRRTREFLPRVAECYVRDMKAELAVMARAVLDVALKEVFPDEEVRHRVGAGKDVVLERRIQCAAAFGTFDGEIFNAADQIRKAGNLMAHPSNSPNSEVDAVDTDGIVRDLLMCLRRLDEVSN